VNAVAAHTPDYWWLCSGAVLMALSAMLAWRRVAVDTGAGSVGPQRGSVTDLALAALAVGIALRWSRIGHGPFLNMFEILASSLLILGIVWRAASWRLPVLQGSAPVVLSLLAVMGVWLLVVNPADSHLPPTYEMPILWFHVAMGKIFLGCALVATGLAGVLLARTTARAA